MSFGTVTQAAAHLRVTQPAVSRMLANLESELGLKLFERAHGRLLPTEECEQFYREVERLLAGVNDMSTIARDIRERRGGHLRIVAMQSVATGLLPIVLGDFVKEHPSLRVSLDIRSRRDVQLWISGQQFDLGAAVLPIEHAGLSSDPFIEADLYVVAPHGHRLAARKTVKLPDLQGERFVALPNTALIRHAVDRAMEELTQPYVVMTEAPGLHSACQLVSHGLGITIADSFTIASFAPDQFVFRPFASPIRRIYGFLFPNGRPRSSLSLQFAERMKSVAKLLVAEVRSRAA
jgi:DNA-binding transcriptional LysR family regulator